MWFVFIDLMLRIVVVSKVGWKEKIDKIDYYLIIILLLIIINFKFFSIL